MKNTSREFCLTHRTFHPAGATCEQCAAASDPAPIMLSALPEGAYAFCPNHDILYHIAIGARCPLCRRAQRDAYGILEGRVSDLSAENEDLRRRATVLEHQLLSEQERANREARELEHAYRIVESPTTNAEFKAAAQMRLDQIGTEREQRTLACAILRIARLEAKLDEWIGHVNFKLQVLDPDTDGL